MLGSNTRGKPVRPTESDAAGLDTTTHVVGFGTRVDNLINRLHLLSCQNSDSLGYVGSAYRKVPGHELDNWVEPSKSSPNSETSETVFSNPILS